MKYEQAQKVLQHIVVQRLRWGKQYDASDVGLDKLIDALIAISQEDDERVGELKEELTLARRQLAASTARETKLKKRLEEGVTKG